MALPNHLALVADGVDVPISNLTRVSAALSKQVNRDFQPLWEVDATVDAFARLEDVPPDYWPIIVTNVPQGGGYHETKNGQPYALVDIQGQWSLTASHECLEMLADPFGRRLRAANLLDQAVLLGAKPARVNYLVEICDPSEAGQFAYHVNGIVVSDFFTPNFYDPVKATGVRYSFNNSIDSPLQVLQGGYISWQDLDTGDMMQLRMFPDQFSNNVPHLLNLSKQTDFEKLLGKMSLRSAVDLVTDKESRKNMAMTGGAVITSAHIGTNATTVSSASRAAALRIEIAAWTGTKPAQSAKSIERKRKRGK